MEKQEPREETWPAKCCYYHSNKNSVVLVKEQIEQRTKKQTHETSIYKKAVPHINEKNIHYLEDIVGETGLVIWLPYTKVN